MNGLTLRMVGDKKCKPVKKDVETDDLHKCLKEFVDSNLDPIQKLFRAVTVEEQINIIKEIFTTMKDKSNSIDLEVYVDVVVNIFLCTTGTSPLKSQLSRLMRTAPADLDTQIQDSLIGKLNGRLSQLSFSVREVSERSAALSSCLEVSNNSHFSSKDTQTHVLDFFEHSMRVCLNHFQEELGPAKKLSVITSLHGCVRCAITFYQKYSPRTSDSMLNLTIELMGNPDLPLDTRANLGILSVLIVQQNHCHQWQQLLNRVYETYGNDLSTLSLCSGLLNVLKSEDLQTSITFQHQEKEAILIIYDIIISIEESNPSESGIVLGASRCLLLVTKNLLQCPRLLHGNFVLGLLPWIWSHSEHYMDAVRHLATDILSNIVSVGALQTDVEMFDIILDAVCSMEVDRRCRHLALTVLVGRVPVSSLLDRCPNLVTGLCQTALKGPGVNTALYAVEGLMCQDYKERPTPAWTQLWLHPFLRQTRPSPPLEHALTAAIRLHPPLLHHIVDAELNINSDNIGVILMCLKIGRKWNLLKGNDSLEKWKGLLDFTILQECMYHCDDEVRLSSLALITESPKTTEEFSEKEIELVKQFLQYNMANQSPAVRQKSIAHFKKFLCRLRESMGPLERKMLKTKDTNVEHLLRKYSEFCHWLWKICQESLFPGASPSRRSTALAVMSLVKENGLNVTYDEQDAKVLLSCLLDSYEENKAIARDLLIAMPPDLLKFNNRTHIESYLKKTVSLSSSIRPPDSISAAYYMSVLGASQIATNIWSGTVENMQRKTEYLVLQEVFSKLEEELRIAKLSLLTAASSGPLYGQLFVIRHILQRIDLSEVCLEERWRDLIRRIIETAFCCNDVVACIVNDSSPEGHLPMDLTYSSLRKDTDPQVTCQMVLLCSWRTVKEVSLLLGELVERAPISHHSVGLVTEEQVLAVGDHLTGLLSSTKHRGAFEQAYLGFSKLAGRLWKCAEGKLHELPNKWLNETLGWISSNEKLSATRRSAGIPFIIQGLVCSEMESGSCKSLHHAMNSLLEMAKEGSEEGRVHSLNILRALFRGSALGEAVGPYVAQGIAIAISGFNSSTWAERNSSTLLLSALISRVFGVPREKSETLSWRNKMTGRLFFHRYPSLYGELLSHLQAASLTPIYPALYPVLLVLGRLYPSSLEGTDSNLELMKYVPYVKKVTESSVLKTRSLAASALTALIPPSHYIEHIDGLFQEVRRKPVQNQLHGHLLAILKLVQRAIEIDEIDRVKISIHMVKWLDEMFTILSSKNHSFITRNACVEILIYLFSEFYKEIPFQYIGKIDNILQDFFLETSDVELHTEYGFSVFLAHASILILILKLYNNNEDLLLNKIIQLISHSSYDVFSVVLDFLDFILKNDSAIFNPDSYDNFKIKLKIKKIDENVLKKVKFSQDLTNVLVDSLSQKKHHEDITRLLKTIRYFPLIFQDLQRKKSCVITIFVNFCRYENDVLAPYSILCIDEFLSVFFQGSDAGLHLKELTTVANIVHCYSNPKWNDDCRESVAILMANHFMNLISGASPLCCLLLWSCALRLMQDENSEIRDKVCTSVLDFVTPSKGIELLLAKFVQLTSNPSLIATGLLYWATAGLAQSESSEDLKDCVFEKGDENIYSEELIVNRICCIHLKHLYNSESDFLSLNIENDVSKWILAESNMNTGSTILNFIDNYKTSVRKLCCEYEPNRLLPLTPFENKIILLKIKFKNIINALTL